MTVTHVEQDVDRLTVTITAEFDAVPARVWQVWADSRQLERWWGPPTHPATFVEHTLVPDARSLYFMTSPTGERFYGWWHVLTVDAPTSLTYEDGFAHADGTVDDSVLPAHRTVTLEATQAGTRMTVATRFASAEAMERMIAMQIVEGLVGAIGQIAGIVRS
jgi:uncharacterized protein YndB with AHSA1/START domain